MELTEGAQCASFGSSSRSLSDSESNATAFHLKGTSGSAIESYEVFS